MGIDYRALTMADRALRMAAQTQNSLLSIQSVLATIPSAQSIIYAPFARFSSGLQFHYSLDENGGIYVFDSVARIAGSFTVTGTRPLTDITWVDGLISKGVNFAGTPTVANRAMISVPGWVTNNISNALTISVWFKQNANENSAGMFVGKWQDGATNGSFVFRRHLDGLQFNVVDSSSVRTDHQILACVSSPTSWNHAVATWDISDGLMEVWLNGLSLGTKVATTTGLKQLPATGVTFGDSHLDPANHNAFLGTLDEIRVWNRRLGDDEIQALYQISGGAASGSGAPILEGLGSPEGVVTGYFDNQVYLELNAGGDVVATWYFGGSIGTNTGWR